jgi:hypothetical protein
VAIFDDREQYTAGLSPPIELQLDFGWTALGTASEIARNAQELIIPQYGRRARRLFFKGCCSQANIFRRAHG